MTQKPAASAEARPFRVLFLCTGNSARSQIAEALLQRKGGARFVVASAGSRPAARVHPLAIEVLRAVGIAWDGHPPRNVEGLESQPWDIVITVCDHARESCPIFPGGPVMVHWGMPDPAAVLGDEAVRHAAFAEAHRVLNRRIDLLLALPVESLKRHALQGRVEAIGKEAGEIIQEQRDPP